MNPRLHQYLDGELPLDALSPGERAEADALAGVIEGAAARLRSAPVPELTARVMAALPLPEAVPAPASVAALPWHRRLAAWLWSPRPVRIQLRPAYGLAFAALAGLLVLSPWARTAAVPGGEIAAEAAAEASPLFVQFRLDAPDASDVVLAGSFTDWEPRYTMQQVAPGVWSVLVPLVPGVHDYTFVVDGVRWIPDPFAPQVPDHFGGANSRLTLLPPQSGT